MLLPTELAGPNTAAPSPYLGIGRLIQLLGIAQRRLEVLVPQPFAACRETHPVINQFGGVRMPQLMQRADNTRASTVPLPAFLRRLIPQRPAAPVLFRPEDRAVPISRAHDGLGLASTR